MSTNDRFSSLTQRKMQFAQLLATGSTLAEAARALNISERTARRYADDPTVCAIIREAEREALAAITRGLRAVARQACATLARAVTDESVPWPARIRACDAVLGHVVKLLELTEIERRLDELEQLVKGDSHAL
jgi:hypothetical protein